LILIKSWERCTYTDTVPLSDARLPANVTSQRSHRCWRVLALPRRILYGYFAGRFYVTPCRLAGT